MRKIFINPNNYTIGKRKTNVTGAKAIFDNHKHELLKKISFLKMDTITLDRNHIFLLKNFFRTYLIFKFVLNISKKTNLIFNLKSFGGGIKSSYYVLIVI